jgi:hypothetical protein
MPIHPSSLPPHLTISHGNLKCFTNTHIKLHQKNKTKQKPKKTRIYNINRIHNNTAGLFFGEGFTTSFEEKNEK